MSNELIEKLNTIKLDKNQHIIPENLKKGIRALGIDGSLELPVKLFDTIADMNADPNPQEDDLAIVYTGSIGNLTETDEFQTCDFPETVTLPSAVSDHIEVGFVPVDGSSLTCSGSLRSNKFNINIYGDSSYRIEYSSSDGINYTRTRLEGPSGMVSGNTVDFGTVLKFGSRWGEPKWNDAIGYFVQVGSADYEGLFKYKNGAYQIAKTQLDVTSDDVFEKTFYGNKGVQQGALQNVTNLNKEQILTRTAVYDKLNYLTLDSSITNCTRMFMNKPFFNIPNFDTSNVTDMSQMFSGCYNLTSVPNFNTSNVTNMTNMFYNCNNLSALSYANITNMLPLAQNLTNQSLLNLGLNHSNFTPEQANILNQKGYYDAIISGNYSTQYTIEYTT